MSTFSIVLYIVAAAFALWAVMGLINPRALYFALPENQTRRNAFFFPLRIALPFAILARMNNDLMSDLSCSWGASLGVCLAFLWFAAKCAATLRGTAEL